MEIRIITQPPNKGAKEMFSEIQDWFIKHDLDIRVRCVKMKSNPKIQSIKDDSSFFWNKKLQGALSNMYSDSKIVQQYSAKLLYEEDSFLAKQLDYCQFIQNVLIQPQEELFGVPTWQPTPREADYKKEKTYSECILYASGCDILKLKSYEEGKQLKMNLFGKECQLKIPQIRQKDLKIRSGHRIYGSEIMFGFMSSKFYQYWSINQIIKYYQQIQLEEIMLELDELNVNVYFTLCIDNNVRINCKISFNTIRLGAQKQVDGNLTYQNGGIIVEKGKDKNTLNFYIKIVDAPKCYIYSNQEKDTYKPSCELKYWRCQNFLINDMMNYIHNGIIRQFSYLRLVVNHEQTKNSEFLKFCQIIEGQGYLNKYNNEQLIPIKKFTDFSVNPHVLENVRLCLNWMMVSCCLGRFKILSIHFNFQYFIENVKDIQASVVAEHINILKKRKYEKNDKEPFQPDKFLDIVQKNSIRHPEVVFDDLLQADLTPSGLIPNYSIQGYFPIQNTEIVTRKQIKGKFQYKQSKIDQEIMKVRIRDENWEVFKSHFLKNTISYKNSIEAPQNKLLFHSFFRQYLKGNFNVLQRRYSFFGFDCRSLRKGEFYIINSSLLQPTMKYMFLQLAKAYKNDQSVVKCSQIQQLLNENFNSMNAMVQLDDIQLKLLENHFEPLQQSVQVRGPLLQVKTQSKIPNREKNKDNNYNYKVLMPQGKVTQDIMKIINEIAFPDEKIDYCAFIIRYRNMKGIITKKHNPNKFGTITLYENMKQKHSSITELFDNIEQPIRVDNKNISEIQILGIPMYKQCKLKLYQALNIISLDKSKEKKPLHRMKALYKQHFKNFTPQDNVRFEQEVVIEEGAYLMGVYDSRLEPDEVFIQIQHESDAQIIQNEKILIFKKNYLREDGIHLFQNVDPQKQKEFATIYKNVIVFSAHMICSKFAFDQFDDKQKFMVIWDKDLIPSQFQLSIIDGKDSYKKLKFQNRDKNASQAESSRLLNSSILDSQEINNDWLDGIKHQMIDYFCFFQCGTNFQELINLYTKLMLVKILYPGGDHKNYQTIADTIKLMNFIYLWFSHCQARQITFEKQLKPFLQDLNNSIKDIEAETRKLFQV